MNRAFAVALIDTATAAPSDIINVGNRFNIYRNNHLTGLIGALSAKFPVTSQLVGTEYFEAVAHQYVIETPPDSPLLDLYGADFPDFLEKIAPPNSPPYLSGVASLEWARCTAPLVAHQPAIKLASREDLEAAIKLPFQLTPGATLIRSPYPVGTIWEYHQAELLEPISRWTSEVVAVWWSGGSLRQKTIPADAAPILTRLAGGIPFLKILNDADDEKQAIQMIGSFTSFAHAGLLVPLEESTEQHENET
ncbi:putative DNA-binding domain-containing protein [Kordiimonas sp.]|uniref:HvfC/BufC family peptide modification chaperone n=1 Tax=Kordiimonas sp. TaxID=1970157 RepID=UPI003A8EA980